MNGTPTKHVREWGLRTQTPAPAFNRSRANVCSMCPPAELAVQVVGCGNAHGDQMDKFASFGLTPVKAEGIEAPLIAQCYASLAIGNLMLV